MSSAPIALITGITGQDGSLLARLLLSKNYEVHGLVRPAAQSPACLLTERLGAGAGRLHLHHGDITDGQCLTRVLALCQPGEIYNLAAQSHVGLSFEMPDHTASASALGPLRLLEALRLLGLGRSCRFYQASTSELFGNARQMPQNEATPFQPRSPYAIAKLHAYWTTVNYREAYGFHASNGILFNHESPLRGERFITRKVTRAVAATAFGRREPLAVGNLDARRDWGHARDYVRGMWLMLQQPRPDDYVFATGTTHTVRELITIAFAEVGCRIIWRGSGADEQGVDAATGAVLVVVDRRQLRPTEVDCLCGDARKARERLGWRPQTSFREMIAEMVREDLRALRASRSGMTPGSRALDPHCEQAKIASPQEAWDRRESCDRGDMEQGCVLA